MSVQTQTVDYVSEINSRNTAISYLETSPRIIHTEQVFLPRGESASDSFTYIHLGEPQPSTTIETSESNEEVTLLEKWVGYVKEIVENGFIAAVRRNSSDFTEIIAEFDIDELGEDDQEILAEGMPLVWAITRERRNGGIQRVSSVTLRRQLRPPLSDNEYFATKLNAWIDTSDTPRG